MELLEKKLICALGEHFRRYAHALDLQLVYMVPRNSIELLNIYTTKFQVERDHR